MNNPAVKPQKSREDAVERADTFLAAARNPVTGDGSAKSLLTDAAIKHLVWASHRR